MTTQQLGFSVLSAPIAAIDRRSLSEAWYSALHLAHDAPRTPVHTTRPALSGAARTIPAEENETRENMSRARSANAAPARPGRESKSPVHGEHETERRSERSPLARKIERTFLHPTRSVRRTTFAIDGSGARVQVCLQRDARGLRLVAVCPHGKRTEVARALQEARFALAARGIALDAHVEERDDR